MDRLHALFSTNAGIRLHRGRLSDQGLAHFGQSFVVVCRYLVITSNDALSQVASADLLGTAPFPAPWKLPDPLHEKGVQLFIGAEDGNIVLQRLGGDHSVKRVTMFASKAAGAQGHFRTDGDELVS